MKRQLIWFAVNGVMALLLWLGFGPEQNTAAKYVYIFVLGWNMVLTLACASVRDARVLVQEKGRPVPAVLCVGYDLLSALFLASVGSFFWASIVVMQMLSLASIYAKAKE